MPVIDAAEPSERPIAENAELSVIDPPAARSAAKDNAAGLIKVANNVSIATTTIPSAAPDPSLARSSDCREQSRGRRSVTEATTINDHASVSKAGNRLSFIWVATPAFWAMLSHLETGG